MVCAPHTEHWTVSVRRPTVEHHNTARLRSRAHQRRINIVRPIKMVNNKNIILLYMLWM